jgi:hypothetical protein
VLRFKDYPCQGDLCCPSYFDPNTKPEDRYINFCTLPAENATNKDLPSEWVIDNGRLLCPRCVPKI